jgi:hypothetical protein
MMTTKRDKLDLKKEVYTVMVTIWAVTVTSRPKNKRSHRVTESVIRTVAAVASAIDRGTRARGWGEAPRSNKRGRLQEVLLLPVRSLPSIPFAARARGGEREEIEETKRRGCCACDRAGRRRLGRPN